MKKYLYQSILTTTILISIVLLYHVIVVSSLNLTHFSNLLFMLALFFLIIGLTLYILKSGFFDLFYFSTKYVSNLLRKKEVSKKNFQPEKGLSQKFGKEYPYFLLTSLWLAGISIVIGFFI